MRRIAERHSCSLWQIIVNYNKYANIQRWRHHLKRFATKIQQLENKSSQLKLNEIINLIAKEIGKSGKSVEILKHFAKSMPPDTDLEDFLAEVNRNRGLDIAGGVPEPEEEKEAVTIMSMHAAKGLTYDVIFLLGMEEGIFPDPTQDINEQRRLCFVAMTRARKELFLCYSRALKGSPSRGLRFCNPSSFLLAIPKEHRKIIANV